MLPLVVPPLSRPATAPARFLGQVRALCLAGLLALPLVAAAGLLTQPVSTTQRGRLGIVLAAAKPSAGAWQDYPGEIVIPPAQQRVVAAPAAGLIEALSVSVGDTVRPGQVLVRIRSAQSQELQRDVMQSGSQLDLAQRQLARDEALFREGLIPQARLEAARAQARQAQALADERRSALRATTGGARVQADGLVSLTAPIQGQVLAQLAEVGQRVEAMRPLYRLAILRPLWVDLQVPAREAHGIRPGDAVQLAAPSGTAAPTAGQVVTVGPLVDPRSQSRTVRARLSEPQADWQPGELVRVRLQRRNRENGVALPANSLMPTAGDVQQVFVARSGDRFELLDVMLLSRQGEEVTVTGLPAGSQVVMRGTAALKALLPR